MVTKIQSAVNTSTGWFDFCNLVGLRLGKLGFKSAQSCGCA